jgi:predicted ester cyclase
MPATAQTFVEHYVQCMNGRQLADYLAQFRADVIWHDPLLPGGSVQGLDNFEQVVAPLFADAAGKGRTTIDMVLDAGDRIAWRGMYNGALPTGQPVRFALAEFYQFTDGLIQEGWVFTDQLNLQEQFSALP